MEQVAIGDSVIYHTLEEEVVLLNMTSQQYYGLDDIGSDMWKTLLEYGNVEAAADSLRTRYQVDQQTVMADLQSLVRELIAADLLKISKA